MPTEKKASRPKSTRRNLPATERRRHLLEIGVAIVREKGWDGLTMAEVARRAGVSRPLVHQYFGDLEILALEIARRFEDTLYQTADTVVQRHPSDFKAALRELFEAFLVDLRDQRLAYVELLTGHFLRPHLRVPMREAQIRKRATFINLWQRYFQAGCGLSSQDARGLAAFMYDGVRGLAAQVDGGHLSVDQAKALLIQVVGASIRELGDSVDEGLDET